MNNHIHSPKDLLGSRYLIIDYIGEGGMQEVYLAIDQTFTREVAVKVPKNLSAEKRFFKSAQTSAKVNHPNVAKTLDYFVENEREYLVEELVRGHDLSKRIDSDFYYLDPHLAAHVIHHLAKGLAASHHAGVFHRDIKPSNIMVSDDPSMSTIKITDFGIAKLAEEEFNEIDGREDSITGSKTVLGALPFLAPEMIDAPKTAGFAADIWALGAILYYLIEGEYPFGTGLKAIPNILKAEYTNFSVAYLKKPIFRPISNEIWEIVKSCLQLDPALRPTADQLVSLCENLCYTSAGRSVGRIAQFQDGTGNWGFIAQDNGDRVFFHGQNYCGIRPEITGRVNFSKYIGEPHARACPILPIKP